MYGIPKLTIFNNITQLISLLFDIYLVYIIEIVFHPMVNNRSDGIDINDICMHDDNCTRWDYQAKLKS